jgi:hypothetical protein
MRVEILDEAEQDLVDGAHFYEAQEAGLGQYFLDSRAVATRDCCWEDPLVRLSSSGRGAASTRSRQLASHSQALIFRAGLGY